MTKEEWRKNIALSYIGCGKPKAELWICGINEKGEWECSDKEIESYEGKQVKELTPSKDHSQTYCGYERFCKENNFGENWKTNDYFLFNIWPFGTQSENIDLCLSTKKFFGIPIEVHYKEYVRKDRLEILRDFFFKNQWKLKKIFLFTGLRYGEIKPEISEFLNLIYNGKFEFQKVVINNKVNIFHSNDFKMFILPHASRISYEVIYKVNNLLISKNL